MRLQSWGFDGDSMGIEGSDQGVAGIDAAAGKKVSSGYARPSYQDSKSLLLRAESFLSTSDRWWSDHTNDKRGATAGELGLQLNLQIG